MPTYRTAEQHREYTLQELAYATGIGYWRLKKWRQWNLLDPPSPPRGPAARYTDKHVAQVRKVIQEKVDRSFLSEMNRA